MKLAQFLSVGTVEANLKSRDRRDVLAELAALLAREGLIDSEKDLAAALEEREELGSTGIGCGAAIPHVRLKGLQKIRIAVGRAPGGLEFFALDGQPVDVFFLMVAPENSSGIHLKALARICRLMKKPHFLAAVREAESAEEILKIIVAEDEKED